MILNIIKKIMLFVMIFFFSVNHVSFSAFWFSVLNQSWWLAENSSYAIENTTHSQDQAQTNNKLNTQIKKYIFNKHEHILSIKSQKKYYWFTHYNRFLIDDYWSLVGIIKLTI